MTGDQPNLLLQQLTTHPFVQGCREEDIQRLVSHSTLVDFASREVIFEVGDAADTFYLVRTGVVSLQVKGSTGLPTKVQSLAEGSVLGWSWLFEPYSWQFDAVADTPVRAIAIDAAALRQEFDADPAFGYRIIARIAEVMADRLHATRRRLLG